MSAGPSRVSICEGRAEGGGRHRHGDRAVQVVAAAGEDGVRQHRDLDVQVAGGAAAGADLALARQVDAHAVGDPLRHLDLQAPTGADPALAGALGARVRDDVAVAAALRAGAVGDDLAEERALHGLHLAAPLAHIAGRDAGARGRAGPLAGLAQHGGVDLQLADAAEGRLGEVDVDPDQRILAAPVPRARPALRAAAEERVDDVAEAEALEPVAAERAAAPVVRAALVRVGEHVVGGADLLETVLGVLVGVDVGVQLAGEAAVGPLDVVRARLAGDAEDFVQVGGHYCCSARIRLT